MCGLLAALIFLAVAIFSGDYWLDLRAEQRRPIDYRIAGAGASEFVAYLGAIGTAMCLTLAVLWRRRMSFRTSCNNW